MSKRVTGCSARLLRFALTSISLRERPRLYDIRGGSLKMLLSNILCYEMAVVHEYSFKLGTVRGYCVTKGKIFLFCFCFCRRA